MCYVADKDVTGLRIYYTKEQTCAKSHQECNKKGSSYGEIGERVFDKYGHSLDSRDVRRLVQGMSRKKKEKKGV